jgi:predicted AAA+ superfamily ATPase
LGFFGALGVKIRRTAEIYLSGWFVGKNRKPLIIRGARQVGKSTLVRRFADQQKLNLIEINLEKRKLNSISSGNKQNGVQGEIDLDRLILEIQAHFDAELDAQTLIFFDEIQAQPELLSVLRYFYEERPDLPIIAAGSLLEFVLENHAFAMPVGRIEYFYLGPMTFREYLIGARQI